MASLFTIGTDTVRIELDNDQWVDIHAAISFGEYKEIMKLAKDDPAEMTIPLLKKSIAKWSLDIPCNEENIEKLSMESAVFLMQKITEQYTPDKKKPMQ